MEKFPEILRLRVGEYICIYNRYKKGTFLPVPKLTFKCRPLRRHYSGYERIPIKNPVLEETYSSCCCLNNVRIAGKTA